MFRLLFLLAFLSSHSRAIVSACPVTDVQLVSGNIANDGNLHIEVSYSDEFTVAELNLQGCGSGTWQDGTLPNGCRTKHLSAPLSMLLDSCIFGHQSFVAYDVYSGTLQVYTQRPTTTSLRGGPLVEHHNRTMQLDLYMYRRLWIIQLGSIMVYGPVQVYSAVTNIVFDPVTETTAIVLVTEVQYPYELQTRSVWGPHPYMIKLVHESLCGDTTGLCTQTFLLHVNHTQSCEEHGGPLFMDGTFQHVFDIACRSDCPELQNITTISLSLHSSTDYCPQVLANGGLLGDVAAYTDATYLIPTDSYVIGTRARFQFWVNATVDIVHAKALTIQILGNTPLSVEYMYGHYPNGANESRVAMSVTDNIMSHSSMMRYIRVELDLNDASVNPHPTDPDLPTPLSIAMQVEVELQTPNGRRRLLSSSTSSPSSSSSSGHLGHRELHAETDVHVQSMSFSAAYVHHVPHLAFIFPILLATYTT